MIFNKNKHNKNIDSNVDLIDKTTREVIGDLMPHDGQRSKLTPVAGKVVSHLIGEGEGVHPTKHSTILADIESEECGTGMTYLHNGKPEAHAYIDRDQGSVFAIVRRNGVQYKVDTVGEETNVFGYREGYGAFSIKDPRAVSAIVDLAIKQIVRGHESMLESSETDTEHSVSVDLEAVEDRAVLPDKKVRVSDNRSRAGSR